MVLQECPKLCQLYLNVQREDEKHIMLSTLVMTSVMMCERINFIYVKQSKSKVMFEPNTTLNS